MSESKIPISVSQRGNMAPLPMVKLAQHQPSDSSTISPSQQILKVRKKPPPVPPRRKTPDNSSRSGISETVIGLTERHLFVRTTPSETYASTITRTRTVAELAQRFLEENVRNSIKPRIYPMESSRKTLTRVPTPFVFTSDVVRVRKEKPDGENKPYSSHRQKSAAVNLCPSTGDKKHEYATPRNRNFKLYGNLSQIPSLPPSPLRDYDYGLDFLHSARFLSNISLTGDYGKKSLTTTAAASSAISLMMMGSPAHTRKSSSSSQQQQQNDFASLLRKWSAPIPPVLSRKLGRASDSPLGKVKVMLRICDSGEEMSANGILGVDQRRKQVTLIDPGGTAGNGGSHGGGAALPGEERRVGVSAPKMFAFDGIFGEDDDQAEICAASAAELVASVVGGEDGCFVSLGYCTTDKKQTTFGRAFPSRVGVIGNAISWLFKSIQDRKEKTGSRFSVRVSALEVTGGSGHEVINDLLLPFVNDDEQAPSAYLLDTKQEGASTATATVNGTRGTGSFPKPQPVLNTVSEVRAPNPVAAGFFLDNAIAAMNNEDPVRHIVFTLHVYQYTIDKNGKGVVGGRSRLHCVMLGNGSPSISVLGGLLLAVLNGQRHLPSRESKLGAILRECLGSLTCRAVIMIHVGHRRRCSCNCLGNPDGKNEDCDDTSSGGHIRDARTRYAETLAALQLGSRVHRLRRSRRLKIGSVGSGNGSGGSSGGSGEEMRNVLGNGVVSSVLEGGETGSSDIDPSSSDLSCDTVIYLGPAIDDATDGEHPPVYLPSLDGEDDPLSHKLMSPKCIHTPNGGPLPKSKSPKPKTIAKQSSVSSEEQWVDGPKVPKYSPSAINNNHRGAGPLPSSNVFPNNDVAAIKKSETWIDGPASGRVSHQSNNFPSPKKTNHHKMRLDTNPTCSISSSKAAMIQEWISNQTHCGGSNFTDHNHLSDSNSSLFSPSPCSDHARNSRADCDPLAYHCAPGIYPSYMYSPYLHSIVQDGLGSEPEYKSLTVFKTCGDNDEQDECPSNGYEFEFIEVVEPDVPVPMKDACLQVTEEDIALSFLEENPLPESDQNFSMGVDAYYFSNGNGRSGSSCSNHRGKEVAANNHSLSQFTPSTSNGRETPNKTPAACANERCFDSSISSVASTCTLTEKNDDYHPLRVLSQECLTVVSTFADSASVNDEDMGRFWPRFSFPNDFACQQQSHPSTMCHGLCKNLASLSQMSLTSNGNGCCAIEPSKLTSSSATIAKLTTPSKQPVMDSKKVPSVPTPPKLSDDSIYKIPGNPVFVKIRKMKSEASDTEEESSTTGRIPPMKLLDLTPIKNNLVAEEARGSKPCLTSPKTDIGTVSVKPQPPVVAAAVCDHHHHQNQHNHQQHQNAHQHHQANNNNNNSKMKGLNCNNSGSLSRLRTANLASHTSTITADNSYSKDNTEILNNGVVSSSSPTSPLPLHISSSEVFTKSPSKSKSRRIAKFFRSNRSKSPKTTPTKIPTTGSSESSGKSSSASTISAETASSDSSSGLGSFPSPTTKCNNSSTAISCIKSPKHQSPNRRSSATLKNQALLLKSNPNSTAASIDYQFTCDNGGTTLPAFLPSPTTQNGIHDTS